MATFDPVANGYTDWFEGTVQTGQSTISGGTIFTAYVDLSDLPDAFWTTVASDGTDLVVTQDDGATPTKISRELVSIDTVAKTGQLWIRYDGLADDDIVRIYVKGSGTETNDADTWHTNFEGVYHMEDGAGSDSSQQGHDASVTGTTGSTGVIGSDRTFDGLDDGYDLPALSGDMDQASDAMSIIAWATQKADNGYIVSNGSSGVDHTGFYNFGMISNPGGVMRAFVGVAGSAPSQVQIDSSALTADQRYQFALTKPATSTAADVHLYVDGAQDEDARSGGGSGLGGTSWNGWAIGFSTQDGGNGLFSTAQIDEVWIYSGELSAAFIATSYRNINDPAAFWGTWSTNVVSNANAGADKSTDAGTGVSLDGSASVGTGRTYSWAITTDPGGGGTFDDNTLESPIFTPSGEGTYTITLTVTDQAGHVTTDTVDVVASPAGAPAFSKSPSADPNQNLWNLVLGV